MTVVDGKIVINTDSLTMQAEEAAPNYRRVIEQGTRLNAASYRNRTVHERWSAEETELFYQVWV